MRIFTDDDEGYIAWCQKHPDGFVVNTYRTPSASYLKVHHATCPHITRLQSGANHWTKDYTNICGVNVAELQVWAGRLGGKLDVCPRYQS